MYICATCQRYYVSLKIRDPPGWSQPLKIFLWYLRKQLILTLVLVLRSQLNPLLVKYSIGIEIYTTIYDFLRDS